MKILIADMFGCRPFDIGYQIRTGFERLGHDVSVFDYRKLKLQHIPLANVLLNKLMVGASKGKDLVLVYKGESLLKGTVESMRDNGPVVVNWNPDEPFGHLVKFNRLENIEEYDAFFTYDKQYLAPLKEINKNSYYLPAGADPFGVHKEAIPLESRDFSSDICLVGTAYPNRVELLEGVHSQKFNLAGPGWNKTKFASQALPYVKINKMVELFNGSKVVLNPYGASKHFICPNPRTFEIPATRSFQLTDMPRETEEFFRKGKEIALYKDKKEFKELTEYYLENDDERNKIAQAGYDRVIKEHTIQHRLEKMLKTLKLAIKE